MNDHIESTITVHVPIRTAYNQWTQFEEFPRFMEGVKEVRQLDDTRVHWVVDVAGRQEEWDAEITHQIPDQRIAWRSVDGARNAGAVDFRAISEDETEVKVRMMYQPDGLVEKIGSALRAPDAQVKVDLRRFKEFIESRGQETGAWRGEVNNTDPNPRAPRNS